MLNIIYQSTPFFCISILDIGHNEIVYYAITSGWNEIPFKLFDAQRGARWIEYLGFLYSVCTSQTD